MEYLFFAGGCDNLISKVVILSLSIMYYLLTMYTFQLLGALTTKNDISFIIVYPDGHIINANGS